MATPADGSTGAVPAALRSIRTSEARSFVFRNLRPATYQLHIEAADGEQGEPLSVDVGLEPDAPEFVDVVIAASRT